MPRSIQEFLPEADYSVEGGANLFLASGGVMKSRTFAYKHAGTDEELAASSNADIFFFEHQLKPGTKLKVQFSTTIRKAKFIPFSVAKTMPMSSKDLPQLLARLSITPTSAAARVVNQTINDCATPSVSGEPELCAASLEQMVDFSLKKLGNDDIQVKSTQVEKVDRAIQEYTIQEGVERFAGSKTVACHAKNFAYPMFICHAAATTRAYSVPLVGANGSKVNAMVACHTNTARWNPKNLAFQMLKVTPGSVPVCHFLPEDHIMWGTSK
uniref:BURP domain-containing protein n=1 Tax=Kalanchoe fedtschenkoi TaxID=63787 RepID=A0A7N0VIK0_KALFE